MASFLVAFVVLCCFCLMAIAYRCLAIMRADQIHDHLLETMIYEIDQLRRRVEELEDARERPADW